MQSAFSLSLSGRIPRKSYWVGILFSNALAGFFDYLEAAPQFAVSAVVLAAFAYKLNLISRRLHDIGRSAWWQLPFVAPLGLAMAASVFATDEMISRFQGVTGAESRPRHLPISRDGEENSSHIRASIHTAMAIIIRFSVRDTKPSGTLESPPTQAHFSSRLSI